MTLKAGKCSKCGLESSQCVSRKTLHGEALQCPYCEREMWQRAACTCLHNHTAHGPSSIHMAEAAEESLTRVRTLAAEDSTAEWQKRIAAEAERDALRAELADLHTAHTQLGDEYTVVRAEQDGLREQLASAKAAPVRLDERDMAIIAGVAGHIAFFGRGNNKPKKAVENAAEAIAAIRAAQEAGNETH